MAIFGAAARLARLVFYLGLTGATAVIHACGGETSPTPPGGGTGGAGGAGGAGGRDAGRDASAQGGSVADARSEDGASDASADWDMPCE